MTDNYGDKATHKQPVKWILQVRHNRQEPFINSQLIPAKLVDKYKTDVERLNTTNGWQRYRVVSR